MSTDTPEKAALRRAATVIGSQQALAVVCGYTDRRNVWPWFKTDRPIPAELCPAIEEATTAAGSPVLCEELRPDVAWHVVRGKAAPAQPVAAQAPAEPAALADTRGG